MDGTPPGRESTIVIDPDSSPTEVALYLLTEAMRVLDEAEAPPVIGARLDHVIELVRELER